jgi:ABC-2 type transport system permease protein
VDQRQRERLSLRLGDFINQLDLLHPRRVGGARGNGHVRTGALHLLPWFFVYLIADVVMLSAWSVALGSACNTPQDAQSLAFLLIFPVMIPMLMLTPILQQPNGVLSTVMSFVPPFTPMIMLLRQSMPGGVPWWQPWVGLVGTFAFTAAVIWAAARIFRIGILAQGKTPKLAELVQWVVRG